MFCCWNLIRGADFDSNLRWRKEAVEGAQEKPRSDSHPVLGAQPEQGVEHHAGLDWTGC